MYDCARLVVSAEMMVPPISDSFGGSIPALVPNDTAFEQFGGLDTSFGLTPGALKLDDGVERYVIESLGGSALAFNVTCRSEMRPDARNRVQLAEGTDPAGLPRLRASCVIESDALRTVDDYLRYMGASLASEGQGRLRIDNEAIYSRVTGGGHTMGTTRMGNDSKTSVVDKDCRVHGYRNLYIAGSSVFTSGGYANPTLTIVALAARLSDHLVDVA